MATTTAASNNKRKRDSEPGEKTPAKRLRKSLAPATPGKGEDGDPEWYKQIYLCGTEWDSYDLVYDVDWDFSHLEDALATGFLAGRKVWMFGATEPQLVPSKEDPEKPTVLHIPVIIVVESEAEPPQELGIKSVQMVEETIVPMRDLKMSWVPYIPPGSGPVERARPSIFFLHCSQRRRALKNLSEEQLNRFVYCMPYIFLPHLQGNEEDETCVHVNGEVNGRPLMFDFDTEMDSLSTFDYEGILEEVGINLAEMKDEEEKERYETQVKELIRTCVRAHRAKQKEAKAVIQARMDALSDDHKRILKESKFYKFYPCNEEPNVSDLVSIFVNRYYGKAKRVICSQAEVDAISGGGAAGANGGA